MIPEENNTDNYEEVNLADYVKIIFKKKRLIAAIFFIFVVPTAIVSFWLPKVYKIDTSLETGIVNGVAIEDAKQVVEKIKGDAYGILTRKELEISEEDYPEIKINNPEGTNLIILKIESDEIQRAKDVLSKIGELILEEHQKVVLSKKESIEKDIVSLKNQIVLVEKDIENTKNKNQPLNEDIKRIENKISYSNEEKVNLEAKIDALQKVLVYEQTPGTQFALFDAKEKLAVKKQEIENLYLQINSLERAKEDLNVAVNSSRKNIEDLNTEINSLVDSSNDLIFTSVIKDPVISERPVSPRPLLNVAIAAVLGLFTGMFFAFIKEWWAKNKN
ncbi:MAG: hypothetical protein ABH919_01690 [bacterium]